MSISIYVHNKLLNSQEFKAGWHGHTRRCCPRIGYQEGRHRVRRHQNDVTTNGGNSHLVSVQNKRLCKTWYKISNNEFIRQFHQSRIHEFLLCFFFQLANCFGPITSSFSFWTTQTEKNSWKKLVKQIGENIWWIRYKLYLFDCHLLNWLEFNAMRVVCNPWLFHFGIEINSNL